MNVDVRANGISSGPYLFAFVSCSVNTKQELDLPFEASTTSS